MLGSRKSYTVPCLYNVFLIIYTFYLIPIYISDLQCISCILHLTCCSALRFDLFFSIFFIPLNQKCTHERSSALLKRFFSNLLMKPFYITSAVHLPLPKKTINTQFKLAAHKKPIFFRKKARHPFSTMTLL